MLKFIRNKFMRYLSRFILYIFKCWKNRRYFFSIIVIIIISIWGAKCIDWYILGNPTYSNVSNEVWMGFLGSYIGSIIGGIITLIGVIITIKFTVEQSKEEKRLSLMPYIRYSMVRYKESEKHHFTMKYKRDDATENEKRTIILENIGMSTLVDFRISNAKFKGNKVRMTTSSLADVLKQDEKFLLSFDIDLKREKIEEQGLKVCMINGQILQDVDDKYKNVGGILEFDIYYRDLLNYKYIQNVKIGIFLEYRYDKELSKWYYLDKPLVIIQSIDKAKVIK